MGWPAEISEAVAAVRDAPFLTAEQKHDIFFNNAVSFFGWSDLKGQALIGSTWRRGEP